MSEDNNKNFSVHPAKLKWACRRGMLELDVLLGNFLKNAYSALLPDEKKMFIELLNYSDPELFSWLMGHEAPHTKELILIIEKIRIYARSRI